MTQWKDIPGYEDKYQVSSDGQLRSKEREVTMMDQTRIVPSKILSAKSRTKNGDFIYGLRKHNSTTVSMNITQLAKELFG